MEDYQFIDGSRLTAVIEALIFASPEPMEPKKLIEIVGEGDDQLIIDEVNMAGFVDTLNDRDE